MCVSGNLIRKSNVSFVESWRFIDLVVRIINEVSLFLITTLVKGGNVGV